MNCPRCGYICPPLETYCLRCRVMDAGGGPPRSAPPRVVPVAERTMLLSDVPELFDQTVIMPSRQFRGRRGGVWGAWPVALCVALALIIGLALGHLTLAHQPSSGPVAAGTVSPGLKHVP